jgi:hypothetical protein
MTVSVQRETVPLHAALRPGNTAERVETKDAQSHLGLALIFTHP